MNEAHQAAYDSYARERVRVGVGGELTKGRDTRFAYRPGELLVAARAHPQVGPMLRAERGQPDLETTGLPVVRYRFPDRDDLPDLVADLRGRVQVAGGPPVALNHVMFGAGSPFGCPAMPAQAVAGPGLGGGDDGRGVAVGVLDTGIVAHPEVDGRVEHTPGDADLIDENHNDHPDWEAGHGLFVAGVVLQGAPGATVVPARALHSTGAGDELMLAQAVAAAMSCRRARPAILNLSLGGFTHDDQPPLAMAEALSSRLLDDVAIVCASGNWGAEPGCQGRPVWPAAFPNRNVFAVAALHPDGSPAPYSNTGAWVDACAVGDRVSTFLEEKRDIEGNVPQTFEGWARWEGTSFAAPAFAGAIAAVMTRDGCSALAAAGKLIAAGTDRRAEGLGSQF